MADEGTDYLSYLVRLWRARDDQFAPGEGLTVWRASIENPHTGERRAFRSLDALVAYLRRQIGAPPEPGEVPTVDEHPIDRT